VNGEQYSLAKLRDIVLPDPPPLWPPAPGAWVALGIAVAILSIAGWRLYTSRQRKAYRRAGLRLLADARTVYDVSVTMKRVALAAFPRERVASLYGDDWATFLQETCPRGDFSGMVAADPGSESSQALIELAGTWIRHHRVPAEPAPAMAH
jgi:Domain of unknown function (DUF4381)